MKKIIYIGFLAIVLLFSCSKEQPLSPIISSDSVESSQITGPIGPIVISDDELIDDVSGDVDITDPEKEDKEKTNKKAKN